MDRVDSPSALNNQPIRFLELLGFRDEQLQNCSIRLNASNDAWPDVMEAYYSNHDWLMDWVFTKKWPGKRTPKGGAHPKRILQFIQLNKNDNSRWLFIGDFIITGEHILDDGKVLYDYTEVSSHAPLAARTVVKYVKKATFDNQLMNDLSNQEYRHRFYETMILEKITQSPVSALPFPGYENVRITHQQLVAAVENDEWKSALGSVQAVYLQTDLRTGWHYVGSAYSHEGSRRGLLSRWTQYAYGDHSGENTQLKKLGAQYIETYFQYSILEIFDMRAHSTDIINREHWWMDTLSSVYHSDADFPHGYNSVVERMNDQPVD